MSFLNSFKKKSPTAPKTTLVEPQDKQDKKEVVKAPATVSARRVPLTGQNVLLHPLVTEKITRLAKHQQTAFAVALGTNKVEVKKAVQAMYGVKPLRVQMVNVMGKQIRFGQTEGKRSDWKKAIITLPAGTSLESFKG